MSSSSAMRRFNVLTVAVVAAGSTVIATAASGGPERPASPAVSSAASARSPAVPASASDRPATATRRGDAPAGGVERRDPLDVVRERLARRLGTVPSPGSEPNVVRLTTPAGAASGAGAAGPTATPGTAAAPTTALKNAAARTSAATLRHPAPGGRPRAASEPHLPEAPRRWDYAGSRTGPLAWSRLDPAYAVCASGARQSPIDIRGGIKVDLEPIRFDYQPGAFRVLDTGHAVQVNVAPGSAIELGGRRYELLQFHFHRPSEERIEGRQFAMAAHLLHRSADGRLAVVAVLLEPGPAQPLVQAVWNNLPLEQGEEVAARAPLDPADLLPADRRYATYMGSLTEPPCTEGVLWVVLKQPVGLTPEQEAVYAHLYPMNARPLQAGAGRLIKESN